MAAFQPCSDYVNTIGSCQFKIDLARAKKIFKEPGTRFLAGACILLQMQRARDPVRVQRGQEKLRDVRLRGSLTKIEVRLADFEAYI